jgi:hypothetical protein
MTPMHRALWAQCSQRHFYFITPIQSPPRQGGGFYQIVSSYTADA